MSATVPLPGSHLSVNDLETALFEATRAAGGPLSLKAFAAFQEVWLAQYPHRFSPQRGRTVSWLTPFVGPIRLPVRGVRDKTSGRYLTLSKVFLRPKATRLLSPALEQEACAGATQQNHRRAPQPTPPQCQSSSAKWTPPGSKARQRRRQGPRPSLPRPSGPP